MWFMGTIAGGLLISYLLRDKPVVAISGFLFIVALLLVLTVNPVLGWYMVLIPLALVAMWLLWKAMPWLIGFAMGVAIVLLLLAGLVEFLSHLGL